jgi:hypothetical protein
MDRKANGHHGISESSTTKRPDYDAGMKVERSATRATAIKPTAAIVTATQTSTVTMQNSVSSSSHRMTTMELNGIDIMDNMDELERLLDVNSFGLI